MPDVVAVALDHGITLACRQRDEAPPGAPTVLLLHGFPEAAFVWDGVMARIAHRARCVAPNLRGYPGSSRPALVADYRARHLVGDVAALIRHLGAPVDLLVAHDWGGALAWLLAAQQPGLVRRLMILNAPHHALFLRALRDDPAQQAASAYMNFLCRPDAAARLCEDGHRRLWAFFTAMGADDAGRGGGAWLTEAVRAQYLDAWGQGLEGPLNYYRASPLRPPRPGDDAVRTLTLPPESGTVRVPTTVVWGDADTALPPRLLEGLADWVPDLTVHRVPEATHWIVHEQPALVADHILQALTAAR